MADGQHDDYSLQRVPVSARRRWFPIAVQRFGQISALSQFLLGATLGYSMSFANAFWAILLGSVFLEIVICVVGIIGQKEGLQTSLLARWTGFGEVGSALVGLAIAISLIGWFGIQSAIAADSLNALMPGILPRPVWSILAGLVVTAIVVFGFRGMQWLANLAVPLFLVAGGFIVGAIITSDMTRFNRSTRDVIKQSVLGISLGEFLIGLSGVLLAHAARSGDIVAIVTSAVGLIGLLIILTGTLKINDWNLYSSVLGLTNFVSTTFRRTLHLPTTTIVVGVVGTLLAAFGILQNFVPFLIILSAAFPPIAGIMIAEYFVVKKFRPDLEATRAADELPPTTPRIVWATIVVWLVSSLVGYFFTAGIPSLTSLVLSFVLYVVAGRLGLVRGSGVIATPVPEPAEVEA